MTAVKKNLNIQELASDNACFDLQFRKDSRKERLNSPTYYRWKVQFIMTGPKEDKKVMEKIKKELGCGNVNVVKNQARFSVQNISEISETIVPFFKKHRLSGNKQKDFELWQRAVSVIYKNKGIYISKWQKSDLVSLMHIHTSIAKYKQKHREPKWLDMAKTLSQKS